jgi:hypothetical protein
MRAPGKQAQRRPRFAVHIQYQPLGGIHIYRAFRTGLLTGSEGFDPRPPISIRTQSRTGLGTSETFQTGCRELACNPLVFLATREADNWRYTLMAR